MDDQKRITHTDHARALDQRIEAGQAANRAAARHVFSDYRSRKAANTLQAHEQALTLFADFLAGIDGTRADLTTPAGWTGITWGLIETFKRHMLNEGYAISTINLNLSILKTYARLASKAGTLDKVEYLQIKDVSGYSRKETKHIDAGRERTRRPGWKAGQRITRKKADHTPIPKATARALKRDHDDNPQGRRDAVLMCILLDLGLRCGEVAALTVGNVNLPDGTLTFYRSKVDKEQTHNMPRDLLRAMRAYFKAGDAPLAADAPLLRSSRRGYEKRGPDGSTTTTPPRLTDAGMSERAITARVKALGNAHGISKLSAHDCRHFWATSVARSGTDAFVLQEAGGWNSLAMPRRYVEAAQIANEGVRMGDDDGRDFDEDDLSSVPDNSSAGTAQSGYTTN